MNSSLSPNQGSFDSSGSNLSATSALTILSSSFSSFSQSSLSTLVNLTDPKASWMWTEIHRKQRNEKLMPSPSTISDSSNSLKLPRPNHHEKYIKSFSKTVVPSYKHHSYQVIQQAVYLLENVVSTKPTTVASRSSSLYHHDMKRPRNTSPYRPSKSFRRKDIKKLRSKPNSSNEPVRKALSLLKKALKSSKNTTLSTSTVSSDSASTSATSSLINPSNSIQRQVLTDKAWRKNALHLLISSPSLYTLLDKAENNPYSAT